MSICDLIVVMEEGKLLQAGQPQQVYDDPANLFVAKFLGTPPINVFRGTVADQKLRIGSQTVLDVPGVADGDVTVGIRPEGLVPEETGSFACALSRVEVMGRDISIVCTHPECENAAIRAIVSSAEKLPVMDREVRFGLVPEKVCLFDAVSGQRIRF